MRLFSPETSCRLASRNRALRADAVKGPYMRVVVLCVLSLCSVYCICCLCPLHVRFFGGGSDTHVRAHTDTARTCTQRTHANTHIHYKAHLPARVAISTLSQIENWNHAPMRLEHWARAICQLGTSTLERVRMLASICFFTDKSCNYGQNAKKTARAV